MDYKNHFKQHKEQELHGRWIHYNKIQPLLSLYKEAPFEQEIIGYSFNKVPIHQIKVGTGAIRILLWSQMHGDESTATKSIFDTLKYIKNTYKEDDSIVTLLENCTLLFLPMLNPDGAFLYTRENAMGIDLNRDALELATPEAQLLDGLVSDFKPHYAFNLHDQTSFYNVAGTNKPATLSFLAPAEELSRKVTKTRERAMSVIVAMYTALQKDLKDQIGRYNDAFCHNCFGDTIQKRGVATILIESGYFHEDDNREKVREFHFIALLEALYFIATNQQIPLSIYSEIPLNEKSFYDVLVTNVNINNRPVSVGLRYKYGVKEGKLIREIDTSETCIEPDLNSTFFHKRVDAKKLDFDQITLDFLNNH